MVDHVGKYNRTSIRLPSYDYSQSGWYFITINACWHKCIFGRIVNRKMRLSAAGKLVLAEWHKSLEIRKELSFDQWVIMPNHIHAIVIIEQQKSTRIRSGEPDLGRAHSRAPLQRKPHSLASFIGQFKATVTRKLRGGWCLPTYVVWQRNYYEHVIRTERALHGLREYIQYNPLKWHLDRYNPVNLASGTKDDADRIVEQDAKEP